MRVKFIAAGNPAPWTAQMRKAERSLGFQNMQAWQIQVGVAAKVAWTSFGQLEPWTGPVGLSMSFFLAASQRTKRHADGPDRSNLYKAAEDALQGICYTNDSQTYDGGARKIHTSLSEGYTIIWVWPYNGAITAEVVDAS